MKLGTVRVNGGHMSGYQALDPGDMTFGNPVGIR
jgi:hypothetical protein